MTWPAAELSAHPQAVAALRGVLPAVVLVVDRDVAATAAGAYHLHLRGGDDWTLRVHDGTMTVESGRPRRADLHLSAHPVGFLLNGVGLISPTRLLCPAASSCGAAGHGWPPASPVCSRRRDRPGRAGSGVGRDAAG